MKTERQRAEAIFNKFCTQVNTDYKEYIILDKKGFIDAILEFCNEGLREELGKYAKDQWTNDDELIRDTVDTYLKTKQ